MIHFAYPQLFWLLLLPFVVYFILPPVANKYGNALRIPFLKDIKNIQQEKNYLSLASHKAKASFKFFYLFLIWGLLVTAAARPQNIGEPYRLDAEHRDIMLVIDISTSMLQPDFSTRTQRIDRLSAVKAVVSAFIENRTEDRIGLILFGTQAYLQAPLTFDKAAVADILLNTDAGMAGQSTAIGDALGLALKTLRDDKNKKNKVIILLSDGENNDGSLDMAQAIELAEKENIKIYTIGVGADYVASLFNFQSNSLDEASLKELAKKTAGNYFRATDLSSLAKIYQQIDSLEPATGEKNIIQDITDLFYVPLAAALILAVLLIFVPKRFLR